MKYVSKISVVLFAMVSIAACSKKGKGGAPAPAAPGIGALAAQCVAGQAGCTPYYGPGGQWSGALTVINPTIYQQMIMMNGAGGVMPSQYVGVSIRLDQTSGRFKISTAQWNRWVPMLQKQGQAYQQGINNISIITQNYYAMPYQQPMIYPGQPIAPGAQNMITVSVQFVDATQMVGNAQIAFNGVVVAQGQVSGRPFYNNGGYVGGGVTYQTSSYAPPVLPANRYY